MGLSSESLLVVFPLIWALGCLPDSDMISIPNEEKYLIKIEDKCQLINNSLFRCSVSLGKRLVSEKQHWFDDGRNWTVPWNMNTKEKTSNKHSRESDNVCLVSPVWLSLKEHPSFFDLSSMWYYYLRKRTTGEKTPVLQQPAVRQWVDSKGLFVVWT